MSVAPAFAGFQVRDCDTCSYCVFHPPAGSPREDCSKPRTAKDVGDNCWVPSGCVLIWKEEVEDGRQ